MPDNKNPRVHAEILPALAAVVGPTTKILRDRLGHGEGYARGNRPGPAS